MITPRLSPEISIDAVVLRYLYSKVVISETYRIKSVNVCSIDRVRCHSRELDSEKMSISQFVSLLMYELRKYCSIKKFVLIISPKEKIQSLRYEKLGIIANHRIPGGPVEQGGGYEMNRKIMKKQYSHHDGFVIVRA